MNKTLLGIFAAAVLIAPSDAMAAPTGWKPAADCVVPPDHGIYAGDGSNTLTGCITEQAWAIAQAAAAQVGDQSKLGAFIFPSGTTKVGTNGILYTCPWWFGPFSCILPPFAR